MYHQQLIPPHVLIFPLPIQGHVNSMLRLAELLCLAGFHVTFVISHYAHARIHCHANAKSHFKLYPRFSFERISDGLPDDHPRAGMQSLDVVMSLNAIGKPLLRELVSSINCQSSSGTRRQITCIIGDGSFDFAADVANETGIPLIYFRTISAVCFWADFCLPQVAEACELPLNGKHLEESDKCSKENRNGFKFLDLGGRKQMRKETERNEKKGSDSRFVCSQELDLWLQQSSILT